MSKLNKRASLLAAAVALALPGAVFAASVTPPNSGVYASNVLSATPITVATGAEYTIAASDNLWGRTSGFGVRITLNGAQFDAAPDLALSDDWDDGVGGGVTATAVTFSGSTATYSIVAPTDAIGSQAGKTDDGIIFDIGSFDLKNITGGTVTATVTLFDPTTTNPLQESLTATYTVLTSMQGVTLALDTSGADADKKIDVFAGETVPAKTAFSVDGKVGYADANSGNAGILQFYAGDLVVTVTQTGTPAASVLNETGGAFVYDPAADEFTFVVKGTQAFEGIQEAYLDIDGNDSYSAGDIDGVINGDTITFAGVAPDNTAGGTYPVFLVADYSTDEAINTQILSAAASVEFDAASNYTDFAGAFTGNLLPLEYNGSVVQLYNVNPAANVGSESFLRYTNKSNVSYRVTLDGVDDAGRASAGKFSFELGPKESITLTSREVEQGNAAKGNGSIGAPSKGKWVITATAEGSGLVAAGLNRNSTGTISTINDEKHGQ